MSCKRCCKKSCDCPSGPQGPRGLKGDPGATGPCCTGPTGSEGSTGQEGPTGVTGPCCTGPTGATGGDTFLKSNILNIDNVPMPPMMTTTVASFMVGDGLSPARILNVFSSFSIVGNNPPSFAAFQLRVDGIVQPNLSRLTIDATGGESGSLLALVPVGAGPRLVELLGTNQLNATALQTANAAILVQETTV